MRAVPGFDPADIMPGRKAICAELARHAEQVGELRPHIAADAGDRRAAGEIFVGELLDHIFAKCAFVVEHVMRDSEPVGDRARIGDVVARAARALAPGCRAIIVKLQGDADHLIARIVQHHGRHRAVDASAHRYQYLAVLAHRLLREESING